MDNSVKQEIFNSMIQGILHQCTLSRITEGELTDKKDTIIINTNGIKNILYSVPMEFDNKEIHGNTRNALAKDFVEQYSFEYLKKLYDEKIKSNALALEKHLKLEDENKHKLELLYEEINILNKYTKYNNEGVRWVYSNGGQNCIIFNCKKDQWHTEAIEITNNNTYDKYILFISSENMRQELTHNELIIKINSLIPKYEIYYQSCKAEKEASVLANKQKLKIINKVEELYDISATNEILFKNKKTFIGYRKGVRYAVGEGKSGKYYNCNHSQLQQFIITKGITEYYIINEDKDTKTYEMTNKELLSLPYQVMI